MKGTIFWKMVITITVILLPAFSSSQETYKFERMWPTLKQPWYFFKPCCVATDSRGNIYITDFGSFNVKKFSQDGLLITSWGSQGTRNGEFSMPTGIATHEEIIADKIKQQVNSTN